MVLFTEHIIYLKVQNTRSCKELNNIVQYIVYGAADRGRVTPTRAQSVTVGRHVHSPEGVI